MRPETSSAATRPRAAGLLLLLMTIGSFLSLGMIGELVDNENTGQTAQRILRNYGEYQTAFYSALIGAASMAGAVALLYEVFRPVSQRLARLSVSARRC